MQTKSLTRDDVLSAAIKLSEAGRGTLITRLMESVGFPWDKPVMRETPLTDEELLKRANELDQAVDGDQAVEEILAALKALDELTEAAMKLSEEERAFLSQCLLESMTPAPEPAEERGLDETLEKRIREVEEGRVKLVPYAKVKARYQALLNERSQSSSGG